MFRLSAALAKVIQPWTSSEQDDILTFNGGIPFWIWSVIGYWHISYAFQYYNHGISDISRSCLGAYYIQACRRSYEPFMNRKALYASSEGDYSSSKPQLSNNKHRPLPSDQHIRLVHLSSKSQSSSISIRFSVQELTQAQTFETLSYVWGSKSYKSIDCEQSSVAVRTNLYEALHALQRTDGERVLWIDALCINQDDLAERAQQVAMMRSIYASSQSTLVWLGKEAALSKDALDLFCRLADFSKRTDGGNFELGDDQLIWKELGELYSNMWFFRIWIIQEVVVARHVEICLGEEWWKWDDFTATSHFALEMCKRWQLPFDPTPAYLLNHARTVYQTHGPYLTVLHALALGKSSFASLDIDKVYAVLALSDDPFDIDYNETAAETYLRLANTIVSRNYAPAIFDFVDDHSFRLDRGLPSWVPDWEVRHGPRTLMSSQESQNWKASLDTTPKFSIEDRGRNLIIRGFVIDTLDHIGDIFLEETPVSGSIKRQPYTEAQTAFQPLRQAGVQMWAMRRMRQWDNFKKKHAKFYAKEELQEAFLYTLIAGSLPPSEETLAFLKTSYTTWCKLWLSAASNSYSIATAAYVQHSPKDVHEATQFFQTHVAAAWYRRLFTTKTRGFMGLCPNLARRHHLVVIVHGVTKPLILKRLRNNRYRFVGTCYIHGITYGEAMAFDQSNNIQDFVLV